MSDVWMTEYGPLRQFENEQPAAWPEPAIQKQTISHSGTSVQCASGFLGAFVRLVSNEAFHYEYGANPTAVTSHNYVPANYPLGISVSSGDKIAVIQA